MNHSSLFFVVKRNEQAANLQSQARKSNIRMFLMPEIKMNEEKSLSYAAGELKRSHLTGAVLLCDPKDIYKVIDQVSYNKIKDEHVWCTNNYYPQFIEN